MNIDFQSPQKQSIKGIVVLFADTFQKVIRGLWVPLLLLLYKLPSDQYWIFVVVVLGMSLLLLFFAYLQYINFTFYLDEKKQEFIINKGVLRKSVIIIPLEKIQQININQSIVQKLVDTFSLDIDTAGSKSKEASIRAVDEKYAQLLKQRLLQHESYKTTTTFNEILEEKKELPFLKLSFSTLIKVGLFSNYGRSIALLIGFFVAIYNGITDVSQTFDVNEDEITGYISNGFEMFSIAIVLMFLIVIVLLINVIRTFYKFYNFEITKQKESLAISSGLFARKNTLLKPSKVQITTFTQNFFQRSFNFFDLNMKQASSTDESSKESKKSDIEVPGCNENEKNILFQTIFNYIPNIEQSKMIRPNIRYIIKGVIVTLLLPTLMFWFMVLYVKPEFQSFFPLLILYNFLAIILIYFGFQNNRLYISKDFVIKKSGVWDIEHEMLETYKIQGVTTKQYFWHKKRNLGHLTLHSAAGDIHFKFGNFVEINHAINQWLFQVETSHKRWM